MRKIVFLVLFACMFLLSLSSCGSELFVHIYSYDFYNTDLESQSYGVGLIETKENSDLVYNGTPVAFWDFSYGKVTPLTAVPMTNEFDIFITYNYTDDEFKKLGLNVKSFEIEVSNNVKINNVDCEKNNKYTFNVKNIAENFEYDGNIKEAYYDICIFNVNINDSVTISIKSVTDESDKVYSTKGNNAIRIIKPDDFVKFGDDYKSFRLDTTNINIYKIIIDYRTIYESSEPINESSEPININITRNFYFTKQARIWYSVPGFEDYKIFRRYEIYDDKLFIDFYYKAYVIHTYEE